MFRLSGPRVSPIQLCSQEIRNKAIHDKTFIELARSGEVHKPAKKERDLTGWFNNMSEKAKKNSDDFLLISRY